MSKYNDLTLWNLVSKVREQVAGGNYQLVPTVKKSLAQAVKYARQVDAPSTILDKLSRCELLLNCVETYDDRLPIDDILCGMLNDDIGETNDEET